MTYLISIVNARKLAYPKGVQLRSFIATIATYGSFLLFIVVLTMWVWWMTSGGDSSILRSIAVIWTVLAAAVVFCFGLEGRQQIRFQYGQLLKERAQ